MLRWLSNLRHTLSSTSAVERRRQQRRYLKIPIEVRSSTAVSYKGFTRDLSLSGMGAVVSAPLKIGDKVWIKYNHPSRGEQEVRAVIRNAIVRQRHGYRFGFEFDIPMEL